MSDLAEFLKARLDEDERVARAAVIGDGYAEWDTPTTGVIQVAGGSMDGLVNAPREVAVHAARHDPARVLAEVEAKRRIIEGHPLNRAEVKELGKPTYGCETCHYHSEYGVLGSGECDTLRLLALPYADHPGYREEWRP